MDNVGRLNRRLTVQTAAVTTGEGGGQVKTWADRFTAWCQVRFLTAGSDEGADSRQLTPTRTVLFTLRRENRTVLTTDRVAFNELLYEIRSVLPDGDRLEWLRLECEQTGEQKTA